VAFVTRKAQIAAIDEWRVKQRPILSRNEAIRRLIDIAPQTRNDEGRQ
jgi:hypothetical protein